MTMKIKNKKYLLLQKYLFILVGAFLMALSVNLIFEPMGMVTGGVSGLAIIVKKLTVGFVHGGVPLWVSTVVFNVPLFLASAKIKGFKFLVSTIFGTVAFIIALMVVPIYDFHLEDYLLASIAGGVIGGVGIGMVFSVQASTGGTDMLASVIHMAKKHISIPQILNLIDGFIILLGALVFGLGNALYAIIAVFITSKVSDSILEGKKFAKMAYIISDHYDQIADAILNLMDRGVTGLSATGMYSNKEKKMLFCVVSRKEIIKIIEISKKLDPKSFVIISDVKEVMGEGFIEYRQ